MIDPRLRDAAKKAVVLLGENIGYGHVMQLAEQAWRERNELRGELGSEHTVGPCAFFLVPCGCMPHPVNCEWCCGSGRVTARVRKAQEAADAR
jgi:hypothetical protein